MKCKIHNIQMLPYDDPAYPVRMWICPLCITKQSWTKELKEKVGYTEGMEHGELSDAR